MKEIKRNNNMYGWYRTTGILLILLASVCNNIKVSGQDSLLVTGKIIAGKDLPVSGVSVSMEGIYTTPAITNEDGMFQLVAPSGNVRLIITPSSEYKPRSEFLNNRTEVRIYLTEEDLVSGYDEVLNLYRPSLRRDLFSAYHSPDPDHALLYPYQSVDQHLQGVVPGNLGSGRSGMPGSGTSSYLRGIRSMYTNNQPLYIVDGLPMESPGLFQSSIDGNDYNPLSTLDPNDITSITVLKDYMSSSIYGMRASNGVILIETLKPTKVETTIDLSLRTGISMEPVQIPQLTGSQYKTLANEVLISSGLPEEEYKFNYPALYSTINDPEHYRYNHHTNWQDEIFTNGLINDFYIRVRGGDEIARYGLSVGYLKHNGIIENTFYDRFSIRYVGTFNVFRWLRMFVSSNLMNSNSDLMESARIWQTSPVLTSLHKSPLLNPYQFDEDGKQLSTLENVGPLGVSNPLAIINNFEGRRRNVRFTTSFRMEGDITKELKINSLFGLNLNSSNESTFLPNIGMELYDDGEAYNVARSLKNRLHSIYSDNYLDFNKEIDSKHHITAAAGVRVLMNRFQIDWGLAKNSHESDEYKQLQNGISFLREMGGENAKWNRLAFYGNGGYSFKSNYFVSGSLVTEYSTRVGRDAEDVIRIGERPFGLFYSLGGAWRISSEPFLHNIWWLEELKIRASYGLVGNDDIGNLSALSYYTVTHYRETTGMISGSISQQDIKFEVNKQWNTGLDISLLGNKMYMTVDLYQTRTEELLVFEPQPSLIGFATVPANNGEVLNRGWEVELFSRILDKGKLKWDMGLNVSGFKNRVEQIRDNQVITSFEGGEYISRVGEPLLSFYGYVFDGVFSSDDDANAAGLTTETGVPFGPGDARFKDLSGPDGIPDHVINEYDKTIIGSPIPELFGGFQSTLKYGRWSVVASLQFVSDFEAYNYLRYQNEKMTDLSNQSTHVLKRWFTEGQVTDVPRAVWNDPVRNASFSSRWIEDASYLRLKKLTIAYTVPEKIFFLRNAQIYVTATNLYTWHSYLGYDPEFSYSYYTMEQGIDYGLMPHSRKFMIGIKLGL